MPESQDPIRPRQWATMLFASSESLPRVRARDQQADIAGNQLKQRLLQRVIESDPDPENFASTLEKIIEEFGEPTGPTRAIARTVLEEWMCAENQPIFTQWLLHQAAHARPHS